MRRLSLTFTRIQAFALLAAISPWTAFQMSGRTLQVTVEAEERDEMQTIGRVLEDLVAEHSLRASLTARRTVGRDSLGATLANAWSELARAAHSLKSSSAVVGLTTVSSGAARIEALARSENSPGIEVALAALGANFKLGVAALRAELEHRAGKQSIG